MPHEMERPIPPIGAGERDRLLDELDADLEPPDPRVGERRSGARRRWRETEISLELESGAPSPLIVGARNVAAGGLSFLHVGMIETGRRCSIELPLATAGGLRVRGTIVACRPVRGSIHEVSVAFDDPIDPEVLR